MNKDNHTGCCHSREIIGIRKTNIQEVSKLFRELNLIDDLLSDFEKTENVYTKAYHIDMLCTECIDFYNEINDFNIAINRIEDTQFNTSQRLLFKCFIYDDKTKIESSKIITMCPNRVVDMIACVTLMLRLYFIEYDNIIKQEKNLQYNILSHIPRLGGWVKCMELFHQSSKNHHDLVLFLSNFIEGIDGFSYIKHFITIDKYTPKKKIHYFLVFAVMVSYQFSLLTADCKHPSSYYVQYKNACAMIHILHQFSHYKNFDIKEAAKP